MSKHKPPPVEPSKLAAYFWPKLRKQKSGCWLWAGYRMKKTGYGLVNLRRVSKQPMLTHRLAWTLARGEIPQGMHVLHSCDNPPCCNPRHLFLGTQKDNNLDRDRKGRVASGNRNGSRTHPERVARGERNGQHRLTVRQVTQIRKRYSAGGITQRALARLMGTRQQRISAIVRREQWKHV